MSKCTKAELIDNIHSETAIDKDLIHEVIDQLFDEVKDALVKNRTVELRGFGTFETRVRKGREKARNPKTGEIVSVESHGVAYFIPGKELIKSIWDLNK